MIDKYKIIINRFTAELGEELDRNKRTLIQTEVDIYDVSEPDNFDGTCDKVYKAKVVGQTFVNQGKEKPIVAKSKRSASQRLRWAFNDIEHDEDFYQLYMDKLIANLPEVIDYLKDK